MKTPENNQPQSDLPINLASPARRALAGAGITNLLQLSNLGKAEVSRLHGIGPNALTRLEQALTAQGLSFAHEKTE